MPCCLREKVGKSLNHQGRMGVFVVDSGSLEYYIVSLNSSDKRCL